MSENIEKSEKEEKISYKSAVEELEKIVHSIENESIDVDQLSEKVKRASLLLKICSDKLRLTEKEVEKILDVIKE